MNMNDLFKAVMALDLDPIKLKLMHVESGEGWSRDKANAVEKEYRRFLCLMKLYPDEDTAPLVDVDTFWHYHILDTMKYAADCEQAFGYFLHHYPYVGLRGEDDEQFRVDSGERMRTLYERTFGDAYPAGLALVEAAPALAAAADGTLSAWCAGPAAAKAAPAGATATAWCAGPAAKKTAIADGSATAWCAGPAARNGARTDGAATAWCAGPAAKVAGGATAWCAGPAARQAAKRAAAVNAATAWCAGPAARAAQGGTARRALAA